MLESFPTIQDCFKGRPRASRENGTTQAKSLSVLALTNGGHLSPMMLRDFGVAVTPTARTLRKRTRTPLHHRQRPWLRRRHPQAQ